MGRLVAFSGNSDAGKNLRCIINRAAPHREVFDEKYDRARRSSKTVKIEGYKSRI